LFRLARRQANGNKRPDVRLTVARETSVAGYLDGPIASVRWRTQHGEIREKTAGSTIGLVLDSERNAWQIDGAKVSARQS
jgi:hypothetical protein